MIHLSKKTDPCTHVMLLVLMAVTLLTSLSLLVFTADAVWKLETLICKHGQKPIPIMTKLLPLQKWKLEILTTGLLLVVVVEGTFVDGEL